MFGFDDDVRPVRTIVVYRGWTRFDCSLAKNWMSLATSSSRTHAAMNGAMSACCDQNCRLRLTTPVLAERLGTISCSSAKMSRTSRNRFCATLGLPVGVKARCRVLSRRNTPANSGMASSCVVRFNISSRRRCSVSSRLVVSMQIPRCDMAAKAIPARICRRWLRSPYCWIVSRPILFCRASSLALSRSGMNASRVAIGSSAA